MTEEKQGQDVLDEGIEEPEVVEAADIPSEEAADELSKVTAELEEVKTQAAEYLDGWQRARAEFVNYRRRQEQQRKQLDAAAKSRVLSHLLPVIDDLERAFCAVPEEIKEHTWVNGLSLVGHKWLAALDKVGLSILPVKPGDAFDPSHHEALTHEPSGTEDEGAVIEVVQKGYTLDDVVLRPALVRVSSGKIDQDQEQAIIDHVEGE